MFGVFGPGEVYERIVETLQTMPIRRRRARAAEALGEFLVGGGVAPVATALVKDASPGARGGGARPRSPERIGPNNELALALSDTDEHACASRPSGRRCTSTGSPTWRRSRAWCRDSSVDVRRHAASALGAMRAKDSVAALIALTSRPKRRDAVVRAEAAHALGLIGDKAATAALVAAPSRIPTSSCAMPPTIALRRSGMITLSLMGRPRGPNVAKRSSQQWSLRLARRLHDEGADEGDYFDRTINPILQDSCVQHEHRRQLPLDAAERERDRQPRRLDTYEDVAKRRDLLVNYGPYGLPNILLKNVDPFDLVVTAYDGTRIPIRTDIRHSGVRTVGLTSAGYHTLKTLDRDGANKNNAHHAAGRARRATSCSRRRSRAIPASIPTSRPDDARLRRPSRTRRARSSATAVRRRQLPRLADATRFGFACSSSFMDIDVVARWNYFAADAVPRRPRATSANERAPAAAARSRGGRRVPRGRRHLRLAATTPATQTHLELGQRARAQHQRSHEPRLRVLRQARAADAREEGVHGARLPLAGHVPRLSPARRAAAATSASRTTLTNYELTLGQIAMESPDPNASRLVAKNLLRPDRCPWAEQLGAASCTAAARCSTTSRRRSRRRALCDDAAADRDGNLDDQHAYCVIARWIQIEQEEAKLTAAFRRGVREAAPVAPPDLPHHRQVLGQRGIAKAQLDGLHAAFEQGFGFVGGRLRASSVRDRRSCRRARPGRSAQQAGERRAGGDRQRVPQAPCRRPTRPCARRR